MFPLLRKLGWRALVTMFVMACLAIAARSYVEERRARIDAEHRFAQVVIVNDSIQARLAKLARERDELLALKEAADQMRGDLVAGVKIRVVRDTVYVPVAPVATEIEDSTRIAVLADTTDGYRIRIETRAPPFPAPLEIGYEIETPEFQPEVGFIRRPEGYYAVVSWAGRTVETSEAFFKPEKERSLSLWTGGEVRSGGIGSSVFVSARYKQVDLRVGFDGAPYMGLVITKKLW